MSGMLAGIAFAGCEIDALLWMISCQNLFFLGSICSRTTSSSQIYSRYLLGTKAGKNFPGSMGPKIQAAIDFVQNSESPNAWAAIGDLRDAAKIVNNEEGTMP